MTQFHKFDTDICTKCKLTYMCDSKLFCTKYYEHSITNRENFDNCVLNRIERNFQLLHNGHITESAFIDIFCFKDCSLAKVGFGYSCTKIAECRRAINLQMIDWDDYYGYNYNSYSKFNMHGMNIHKKPKTIVPYTFVSGDGKWLNSF